MGFSAGLLTDRITMSQVLRTKNKDVNLGPALEFARSLRELAVVDPEATAAISIVLNFGDDDVPPAAAARIATAAREALAAHRNVLTEHCRWVLGEVAKASKERVEWRRTKSVENAAPKGEGRWGTIRGRRIFITKGQSLAGAMSDAGMTPKPAAGESAVAKQTERDSAGWPKNFTDGERAAVEAWKGDDFYKKVRSYDSTGEPSDAATRVTHLLMMRALDKLGPAGDATLYRGLGVPAKDLSKLAVGSQLDLRAISSFSENKSVAKRFAKGNLKKSSVPVVIVAKTKSSFNISALDGHGEEKEHVLLKSTKLKITKIKDVATPIPGRVGAKTRYVYVEEVS